MIWLYRFIRAGFRYSERDRRWLSNDFVSMSIAARDERRIAKTPCPVCLAFRLYCDDCNPVLERRAAKLWRTENPDMSVFACSAQMMNSYRERVMKGEQL